MESTPIDEHNGVTKMINKKLDQNPPKPNFGGEEGLVEPGLGSQGCS